MAEEKRLHDWSMQGPLLALIYNANRDPRRARAMRDLDFMPSDVAREIRKRRTRRRGGMTGGQLRQMRTAFEKN